MKNLQLAFLLVCATLVSTLSVDAQSRPPANPISPGLAVGEKAPLFTLKDQFGHKLSNDDLRGSNGTVLLFFRSADL